MPGEGQAFRQKAQKEPQALAERISPGQACGFYEYLPAAEWFQKPDYTPPNWKIIPMTADAAMKTTG